MSLLKYDVSPRGDGHKDGRVYILIPDNATGLQNATSGEIGETFKKLYDTFGKFGRVSKISVSRRPPVFAFVEYGDRRHAEQAVYFLDGTYICGIKARVELSLDGRSECRYFDPFGPAAYYYAYYNHQQPPQQQVGPSQPPSFPQQVTQPPSGPQHAPPPVSYAFGDPADTHADDMSVDRKVQQQQQKPLESKKAEAAVPDGLGADSTEQNRRNGPTASELGDNNSHNNNSNTTSGGHRAVAVAAEPVEAVVTGGGGGGQHHQRGGGGAEGEGGHHHQVKNGYRYDSEMKRMVRILPRTGTEMVRVGGGWETLKSFQEKHDPAKVRQKTDRSVPMFNRTNFSSPATSTPRQLFGSGEQDEENY